MGPVLGEMFGGTAGGAASSAGAASGGGSTLNTLGALGTLAGGGASLAQALRSQQQVPVNQPSPQGVQFPTAPSPTQTLQGIQAPQLGGQSGSLMQLLQSLQGGR